MTNTAHTPTPWDRNRLNICGPDGEELAICSTGNSFNHFPNGECIDAAEENAAFIVKACNAHDDLKWLVERAADIREAQGWSKAELDRSWQDWQINADKVLAKAKGE